MEQFVRSVESYTADRLEQGQQLLVKLLERLVQLKMNDLFLQHHGLVSPVVGRTEIGERT
jgi:hypothetical protein